MNERDNDKEVRTPLLQGELPSGFDKWPTDVQNNYLLCKMTPEAQIAAAQAQKAAAEAQKAAAFSKMNSEQLAAYQQQQHQVAT